ncbi:MAG: hypothetical protein IPI92_12265 [Gemmatimonadetes bacterium]|nr:hypothetical protein [Gemmatimonadota bacterium]MBK7785780.1 hypothetical protein [Gemmatimonadota bacterium]
MREAPALSRLFWLALLIARPGALLAQTPSIPADTASLRATVTDLVTDFRTRSRAGGAELPYAPRVRLQVTPQLIFFNDVDSTVVVPWWGGLDPAMQESFTALARDSTEGRRLFLDLFNWFLLPHELTHALQAQYARPWRPYGSEAEANVGAVAYWMARGAERRLLALDGTLARALTQLPDPTPAGQDAATYFDQNYEALGANPQAYGYYQFHFIRQAIAHRNEATFAVVVKRIATAP